MFGAMPKMTEPYTPTSSRPSLPRRRLAYHAEDGFGVTQQGIPRVGQYRAPGRALEELGPPGP